MEALFSPPQFTTRASFNATLDRYWKLLGQVGTGQPDLPNDNFDTGEATGPGEYRLNDEAHAELLDALAKQNFTTASLDVRAELLEFYAHPDASYATKRKPKVWVKALAQLERLKTAAPPMMAGRARDKRSDDPVNPVSGYLPDDSRETSTSSSRVNGHHDPN